MSGADETSLPLFERNLIADGWTITHRQQLPGRPGEWVSGDDLQLGRAARQFISGLTNGLFKHQHLALRAFVEGKHVCLTTGTASGKSLPFYAAGLHLLSLQPTTTILAVYPLRALARSQEERWRAAFKQGEFPGKVVRIDGNVDTSVREAKLKSCSVLLATPDVIHAWLLPNLRSPSVRQFLSRLRLLVVDEAHVYAGVFGTNASFLFRRLQHAVRYLSHDHPLSIMAASATLTKPEEHLENLFGSQFHVIKSGEDTSPRHALDLVLVRPPAGQDLNSAVAGFIRGLLRDDSSRFLAFVESRKQAELLTSILFRDKGIADGEGEVASAGEENSSPKVFPYRAGYEESDREEIERSLASGDIRGVVSTSALELGLDIPGITTGVLIGMPATITSLYQRIGRVGRHSPGRVYLIYGGSPTDDLVFDDPARLLDLPPTPVCVYLANPRAQYIHALCFGAVSGEHDMLVSAANGSGARAGEPIAFAEPVTVTQPNGGDEPTPLESMVEWPKGFLELCQRERTGDIPADLYAIKMEAGDNPWHRFPLRDFDTSFGVVLKMPGDIQRLGSLSYAQLMREAYPGAVYYYMSRPYRVTKVQSSNREVVTRPEKYYTTEPITRPAVVYPQFKEGSIHSARRFGQLMMAECELYVSEWVLGFRERRGPTVLESTYPNEYWHRDRFSRNYITTGVVISHPALNRMAGLLEATANLFMQAFLLAVPFERNDVSATTVPHRRDQAWFPAGSRSIVVFDSAYGSLRLSAELMNPNTLRATIREMQGILDRSSTLPPATRNDPAIRNMIAQLQEAAERSPEQLPLVGISDSNPVWPHTGVAVGESDTDTEGADADQESQAVIMPGGRGWVLTEGNCEFVVEQVFLHPRHGLCYRGRKETDPGVQGAGGAVSLYPVSLIKAVPGVSKLGRYVFDTGEVVPLPTDADDAADPADIADPASDIPNTLETPGKAGAADI